MSVTVMSRSHSTSLSPGTKRGRLIILPHFRWHSNFCFSSSASKLLPLSDKNGIGTTSSHSLNSSCIEFDHGRSMFRYHQPRQRCLLRSQWRSHSSGVGGYIDEKNHHSKGNENNVITEDSADDLMLENTAYAAKEIVELRVLQSIETEVWKSSAAAERKKMCRFFFPQLRKATDDLLRVTRDVDSLSDSIEKAREKKGCSTTGKLPLRELHSSFLHLMQIVFDNFDVAMELEGDQCDESFNDSSHSLRVLELLLVLSHRAQQLGLGYPWPLYQRLGIVVAKHPKFFDDKFQWATMTTLGSLVSHSRAEWIQTIHTWSRLTWGSNDDGTGNKTSDEESQYRMERKVEDIDWFHPSLKLLAADGRWHDVYHIISALLRPNLDLIVARDDCDTKIVGGFKDEHFSGGFGDDVVLTSATRLPYLDEDLVFDLLVPMNRQGLLRDLFDNKGYHQPIKSIEGNIIVLMEASIWKLFFSIPNHLKAATFQEDKVLDENYSLWEAIGILLKYGPMNLNEEIEMDGVEAVPDDNEQDSLFKALRELEDLLDESLDVGKDGKGENDGIDQETSDAIALATVLSNQTRHEGAHDSRIKNIGDLNTLNAESSAMPLNETEEYVGRSYSEKIMTLESLDEAHNQSTESYLHNIEGEEFFDFLYDDRAADYEDHVPDIAKQIYQQNGNQQLRYTTSFEQHICEGMQRPALHYDSEDDGDDFEF